MVTNICAKSNYYRLRSDRALGFLKSDNNNKKHKNSKSKNDLCNDWGGSSGSKNSLTQSMKCVVISKCAKLYVCWTMSPCSDALASLHYSAPLLPR